MHDIQIDMLRIIGESSAYSAYRNIGFCICQAQINMEDRLITQPMLGERLRSCMPGSVPQDRHMRSRGVPHEHLASGRYMSTQRGSSFNLSAVAPAAFSGPGVPTSVVVSKWESKIKKAPTYMTKHRIILTKPDARFTRV